MKYILKMGDTQNDRFIEKEVEAESVFEAIDMVADMLDNPKEVEMISAEPVIE